jgi:hypothetical protein
MIVAVVKQTTPSGKVRVSQFRDAVDEATAVDDYVNSFNPPLTTADYLGFDSGWSSYQKANPGNYWAYDFDSPGLVQLEQGDNFDWRGAIMAQSEPQAISGATPFAWETLAQFTADLGFAFEDVGQGQIRVWGRYKADKGGGAGPELRLQVGGVDLDVPVLMADAAGWTNFVFWSTVPLEAGRKLYKLQGKLNNATATLEIEATALVLLEKKF